MANQIRPFYFYHLSFFLFLGVLSETLAQESTTPDGNHFAKSSYYGVRSNIPPFQDTNRAIKEIELPCYTENEEIIRHTGYTLSYNKEHKQANWVAYELTFEETKPLVKRKDKFILDPMVTEGSASNSDYKNSGFDKGHLAPCADMCYSVETMQESFYLSNISPQKPGFNRGIWKNLEAQVRQWAIDDSAIYVVTAGVLTPQLPTTGNNAVSVPRLFYKVILDYQGPVKKGIGFIVPNESSTKDLRMFTVSIDSVEAITGLDFFCRLPDGEESRIERGVDSGLWNWKVENGK
jgi:endonuclease G